MLKSYQNESALSTKLREIKKDLAELLLKVSSIKEVDSIDEQSELGIFRFMEEQSRQMQHPIERLVSQDFRVAKPPLPDPRLIRRIIRERQLRIHLFDGSLFADPAWDMLLDLTAARAEHVRVSVTSLCIASGVPPTTALRWIGQMADMGILKRTEDEHDRRRAFITLSDDAADAMARYFHDLGHVATFRPSAH